MKVEIYTENEIFTPQGQCLHCRISIVILILVIFFKIQITTSEKTQLLEAPEGLISVLRTQSHHIRSI